MIKVGLTGGIGSGKSIVSKVFETLGIPVYNADAMTKKLMNEDALLKNALTEKFGADTYLDGRLNTSYLSSIVFNNPEQLTQLNNLVHPVAIAAAEKWMLQQRAPYCIKEAALIFESGSQSTVDKVIGVFAPKHIRIHRTMHRDNVTKEEVEKRMLQQIDDNIKMRLCDFSIKNDDQSMVLPQVLEIHRQLLLLS
jgi:dephospho-CoA kinase